MGSDDAGLHAHREATQVLAEHPWPRLDDPDRWARNEVLVAVTVVVDNICVVRSLAEDTALQVRGLQAWITNGYARNGLRADGERIMGRPLDTARGRARARWPRGWGRGHEGLVAIVGKPIVDRLGSLGL